MIVKLPPAEGAGIAALPEDPAADPEWGLVQRLIDALPFHVMLVDDRHCIVAANRAVQEMMVQRPADLIGGFCPRLIHGTEEPYPGCPLEEAVRSGRLVEREFYEREADRWVWSSVFATELTWQGRPVFLHSIRDITEQKRAEEESRRLEEQLRRARKLEALGRLAGGIAHDFNNLLTLILNYTGMVASELDGDDPAQENLGRILHASRRAGALTRQLLAFGGQNTIAPRIIDVNEVVSAFARLLSRTLGEDIDLVSRLGCGLWRTRMDPAQLEQVLLNLALNARDAMPTGGRLAIATANRLARELPGPPARFSPEDRFVQITVEDTGCGMSDEVIAHIFDPFFTTKGPGQGTGLGLSSVYGIVTQAGGLLEVASTPGQGTAFSIALPVVEGPIDQEEPVADARIGRSRGETVLVVDDDEAIRALLGRILDGNGYRTLLAADGGEALLLAHREARVDLLLTDVVLRGMSGTNLAELLERLQPRTRVLFMSGHTAASLAQHGVMGGAALLSKPFSEATLCQRIRAVLDEDAAGAAAGAGLAMALSDGGAPGAPAGPDPPRRPAGRGGAP